MSPSTDEAKYDEMERKLFQGPVIGVPAITLPSDFDEPAVDGIAYAKKISGKYSHRLIKGGVGQNLRQEAPQAFCQGYRR